MKSTTKNLDIIEMNKMASLSSLRIPDSVLNGILDCNFKLYRERKMSRKQLMKIIDIFENTAYDERWTAMFLNKLMKHDSLFRNKTESTDDDLGKENDNSFCILENETGFDGDYSTEPDGSAPTPFGDYSYRDIMDLTMRLRRDYAGVYEFWANGNRFCNLCGELLHCHEVRAHRRKCIISEKDFDLELWMNFWNDCDDGCRDPETECGVCIDRRNGEWTDYDCEMWPCAKRRQPRWKKHRRVTRRILIEREQMGVKDDATPIHQPLTGRIDEVGGVSNSQPGQIGLISGTITEQEDSTSFVDPSVGAVLTHPSRLLNKMRQSVNIESTLESRLDRKTLIKNGKITPSTIGATIFKLPFPKALLDSDAFYGKGIVELNEYYNCDRLKFTLQIPTEMQLVGQIQLIWWPGITGAKGIYANEDWDVIRDNVVDGYCQILDVGNENTIVLDVPTSTALNSLIVGKINDPLLAFDTSSESMVNEDLYQSYGLLEARVFTTIRGETDVGNLTYSLYCQAENSDVQFQTIKRDITYTNGSKEQGAVLAIAATAGSAALAAASAAAPAAGAAIGTAAVGAATSAVVNAIGKKCTIQRTITKDIGTLNASAIHDERASCVVGLRTNDVEDIVNETTGLIESIQDITIKRSRVATLNWSCVNPVGTWIISEVPIHPSMMIRQTVYDYFDGPRATMSNMGYTSQFHQLYRGSIDIDVEVVGNAMTRGTLGLVVAPPNAKKLNLVNPIENLGNYAVTYFNIQTSRRIRINVPFNSKYQWNKCSYVTPYMTNPSDGHPFKTILGDILGWLYIIVVNPLRVAPISSVNNVDINLYVSSSDMEYYSPIERRDISLTHYWFNKQEVPIPSKIIPELEQGLSDSATFQVDILGSTSGLAPPSFNNQDHSDVIALCSQTSPYDSIILPYEFTRIEIPLPFVYLKKYNLENPASEVYYIDTTFLEALMQCFAWRKGGINLTIMNPEPTSTPLTVAIRANYNINADTPRNLLVYESSFAEYSSLVESDNSILQNLSLNQVCTYSCPWYRKENCLPSPICYSNASSKGGTKDLPSPTYFQYCVVTLIVRSSPIPEGETPRNFITICQSAGPGFTLNEFIGAPHIYFGKDYGVTFLPESTRRNQPRTELPLTPFKRDKKKVKFLACLSKTKDKVAKDEVDESVIESEQSGGDKDKKLTYEDLMKKYRSEEQMVDNSRERKRLDEKWSKIWADLGIEKEQGGMIEYEQIFDGVSNDISQAASQATTLMGQLGETNSNINSLVENLQPNIANSLADVRNLTSKSALTMDRVNTTSSKVESLVENLQPKLLELTENVSNLFSISNDPFQININSTLEKFNETLDGVKKNTDKMSENVNSTSENANRLMGDLSSKLSDILGLIKNTLTPKKNDQSLTGELTEATEKGILESLIKCGYEKSIIPFLDFLFCDLYDTLNLYVPKEGWQWTWIYGIISPITHKFFPKSNFNHKILAEMAHRGFSKLIKAGVAESIKNRIFNEQSGFEGELDRDMANGVSVILAGLFTMMMSATLKWKKGESIKNFSSLKDFFMIGSGVLTLSKLIESIISAIFKIYKKYINPELDNEADWFKRNYVKCYDMMHIYLLYKDLSYGTILCRPEVIQDILSIRDFCFIFLKQTPFLRQNKIKMAEFGKAASTLLGMATHIRENKEGLPRPAPVSLFLHGDTGIGKTFIAQGVFPTILGARLNKKISTYNRNPESNFWDDYANQAMVIFDDLGSRTDQEDLKDVLLLEGNNPHHLNMASLNDKGKNFTSPWIIYTSNIKHIQSSKKYTNVEAIERRIYKNAFTVKLRPGFAKSDGTIDKSKVKGSTPDEIYEFKRLELKPANGGCLVPTHTESWSLGEIIDELVKQYYENLKDTPNYHNAPLDTCGMDLSSLLEEEQGTIFEYFKDAFGKRSREGCVDGTDVQRNRGDQDEANTTFARKFLTSSNYFIKMHRAWSEGELYFDTDRLIDNTSNHYFENLHRMDERILNLIMYANTNGDFDNYDRGFFRFVINATGLYPDLSYARDLHESVESGYNWLIRWAEIGDEMSSTFEEFGGTSFNHRARSNFKRGVKGIKIIWADVRRVIWDSITFQNDFGKHLVGLLICFQMVLTVVSVLQVSTIFTGELKFVKENLKEICGFNRDPNCTWSFEETRKNTFKHLKKCAEQDIKKTGSIRKETAKAMENYVTKHESVRDGYEPYFQTDEESRMYNDEPRCATAPRRKGIKFTPGKHKTNDFAVHTEQNATEIHSRVTNNLGKILNTRTGNFLYVIVVEGSVILLPYHFFRSSEEGDTCILSFPQRGQDIEFAIDDSKILPIEMSEHLGDGVWSDPSNHDVCFYSLGMSLSGFKSIKNFFIKHENLDKIDNQPGSRLTLSSVNNSSMIETVTRWSNRAATVRIALADGNHKIIKYSNRVCCGLSGEVGMCGAPYLVKNSHYFGDRSVIMAIHQFGTKNTSGGGFVTREMVDHALKHFNPITRANENYDNDDTILNQQDGVFDMSKPFYYTGVRKATEKESCFNFGKSAIRKSPLYGMFEPTHDKSVLDRFDRRLVDPKNFDSKMINKTNSPFEMKYPLKSKTIKKIRKFLVDTWLNCTPIREVGVLPIYDVVNGFDSGWKTKWTRETGLLMNKSAGPIYNKVGKGKFPFFDEEVLDEDFYTVSYLNENPHIEPRPGLKVYTPKSVLTDRINYRLELARNSMVPDDSFCGDSVKDELRTIPKVESGSSRIVNYFQLDYMVLFAQYFGSFRLLYTDPVNAGPKLFSALACDEIQLFPELGLELKDCKRVFGIDYTAYDSSIPPILHEIMIEAINDWYLSYGATEEECQIRRVLWWECIHTQHIYKDIVYTDHHGLPSGVPCGMTTISNIIVNTILFALTCIRLDIPLECLGRDIIAVFMGDDNLCGVKANTNSYYNNLTDKFDRIEVAKTASLFGMKATMPDKSPDLTPEDRFDEITFLKRNFVNNVNPHMYVPGIDKKTIQNQLTFYKPKGNAEVDLNQFCTNIHEALRFASLWGYEYYNYLSRLLKESPVINDYFTKDEINSLIPPHSYVYHSIVMS